MHASAHLGLDRFELGAHPLLARGSLELEPPAPRRRADVREPQKLERVRLGIAAAFAISGGEAPELDQPRLLPRQRQPELCESLAEIGQEPLGVLTMLKA